MSDRENSTTPEDLRNARAEGWDAWSHGKRTTDCPHPFGTKLSTSWKRGWFDHGLEKVRQEREEFLDG